MNPLKKLMKAKKMERTVKALMGDNTANAFKAMQHTASCKECEIKFLRITDHCNSKASDKLGFMKLIAHLPKCNQCIQDFMAIANHAGTKVNIQALQKPEFNINATEKN